MRAPTTRGGEQARDLAGLDLNETPCNTAVSSNLMGMNVTCVKMLGVVECS